MRTVTPALLSCLAALPLLACPKPASIPFTTTPDGLVMLPATVGGTIPIRVILDTGAGLDVLAPSLIEKLHGKPWGQFSSFRMTGERFDLPLFIILELSIGPIVKRNAVVGSWDVLDKFHLDGVISVNDFRQQPFTFDLVDKVVVLETPETLAQRRATGKTSLLQFDDDRGIALDLFAQFLIGNQPGQCEIDTGSPSTTVSTRFMTSLGIEKDGKDVQKHEGRSFTGAIETRYDTNMSQISLAAAPQIVLARPHVSFSDIIYDCVVGIDFWSGRALTIDIADRQLIVSSSAMAH
jgi:hypothetical protein